MHPTAQRIAKLLLEQGITTEVIEFSTSTRTAADAAAAVGTTVAQICKSIVFALDDGAVLVVASGSNRIDPQKVEQVLGRPIGKANAALVRATTGFAIGGVPPVGHATALPILIDQDLLQYPVVYAAAGTPNTVFPIAPADLVHITGGTVIDCRIQLPDQTT